MADKTAPILISLTLPTVVDLSKGPQQALFSVQAKDELGGSGIAYVALFLDQNIVDDGGAANLILLGGQYPNVSDYFNDSTPTTGNRNLTLTGATSPGTYNVTQAYVYDVAGNLAIYSAAQLKALGSATSFAVTGSTLDNTAPTLLALSLPSTVDLSKGAASASFAVQAKDNAGGTGVAYVALFLDQKIVGDSGPTDLVLLGGHYPNVSDFFDDSTPTTGDRSVPLSTLTAPGDYAITQVYVYDVAGNLAIYSAAQLAALGINTHFAVVAGQAAPAPTPTAALTPSWPANGVALSLTSSDWHTGTNTIAFSLRYDAGAVHFADAGLVGGGAASLSTSDSENGHVGTLSLSGSLATAGQAGGFLGISFSTGTPLVDFTYTVNAMTINGHLQTIAQGQAIHLVHGSAGADQIVSAFGNATLDGGAGIDTVTFSRASAGLAISATAAGYTLADAGGTSAALISIERLHFSDKSVALDIDGNGGAAYRLYQAAFDRQPDLGGLGYWMAQLDHGATLHDVADGFAGSAEFRDLFGGADPTASAFVTKLYSNILHRAPEPAGYDYWLGSVNAGAARADVLVAFSESNENKAQLVGTMQHGVDYLPYSA